MWKKFASLSLLVLGCRAEPTPILHDMAKPLTDGGGGMDDMSMMGGPDLPMAMSATIHDIDTGVVQSGTRVTVTGAVLIGIGNYAGKSKTSMVCHYNAYIQDPSQAPSGIRLFAAGKPCVQGDGGCFCPFPPNSGTLIDRITPPNADLGAVMTVTGITSNFAPATDGGLGPVQHEIDVSKTSQSDISVTGTGSVTPFEVSDGKLFAVNGQGYIDYESMLITVKPASPTAIGAFDAFRNFDYAGAHFASDYGYVYGMSKTFPADNQSFSSITGIAEPAFGGGLAARTMNDFVQ